MNLIRKYKLRNLGIEIDKKSLEIISFIESNILNLIEFKDVEYPDYIFYMKGDKNILQYNIKNQVLFVRYGGICSVFSERFKLETIEIQSLMKDVVEEHYKLRVSTTYARVTDGAVVVEEHYKLRVSTTPDSRLAPVHW